MAGYSIEIDPAGRAHLTAQLKKLSKDMDIAGEKALFAVGMKLKTTSQLRLKGRGHIVTSRLINSIYVKTKAKINDPRNPGEYSDNTGKTYSADLVTVGLLKGEIAIGTNVIYGGWIEYLDSYLLWAVHNIDVTQSLRNEMQNFLKFGPGLINI